jgi:spoIIIJ-associated protein
VEWVETTGKTLDEAKDAALDQLGVTEDETEFEVLSEPKPGLFGRTRGEARVRARVRPTQPRPKVERRDRRKRGAKNDTGAGSTSASSPSVPADEPTVAAATPVEAAVGSMSADQPRSRSSRSRGKTKGSRPATASDSDNQQGAPVSDNDRSDTDRDVDLDTHTAIVTEFVTGLVAAFGYDATVESERVDDENAEVRVHGDDLGLLVGPKGATLAAVQELSRTVVHRQVPGMAEGRVRVDVAGYRQRRREALERFVQQVAEQVRETGVAKELEPMAPPDRKVVHDTINEIEGVSTISEGDEPRRRVVVLPS